jgi:hypothetical protein
MDKEFKNRMSNIIHALEILNRCDVMILRDMRDEEGNPCFYAGQRDDLDAGLYGYSITPTFDTQEELYDWVNEHETELLKEYEEPFI